MAKKPKAATFIKDPLWYKDAVIYQVHVKSPFRLQQRRHW